MSTIIDLARVRAAEEQLRALVISGALNTDRTRAWLAGELEEGPMTEPVPPTNLRLSAELLDKAAVSYTHLTLPTSDLV